MPQTDPIERFDSAYTKLSRNRVSSRASRRSRNPRFSWQSSVAGEASENNERPASDADSPDEFEDAAEYITSSRPSRSSTFASVQEDGVQGTDVSGRPAQPRNDVQASPGRGSAQVGDTQTQLESDWVVTSENKRVYDEYFNSLDTARSGFINGQTAAPFFAQSGLEQHLLAHVWMLSDINDEGRLNRDTFALAMHLIQQQRGFYALILPDVRPANYIPPSMRAQPRQQVPSPWSPSPWSPIPSVGPVNVGAPLESQAPFVSPLPTPEYRDLGNPTANRDTNTRVDTNTAYPPREDAEYNRPHDYNERPRYSEEGSQRPGTPTTYDTKCCDCGRATRDVSFCSSCNESFCSSCWDRLVLHRRNLTGASGVPHEKVKPAVAEKVRKVLAPPDNDELRERLHREDALTSWFGIERPADNGPPVFRDYGRLADLMSSTNPYVNGDSSVFVMDGGQAGRDTRTPSLVSFVGQTGAGKSTLIKLLVDLAADDTSNFPTPVIGASGAHLPTSEDVHLYMDPHTADDNAPLLLADCEGLEGGEREPVGARVKRFGRGKPADRGDFTGKISRAIKILSECELSWADAASTRSRNFAVENLYPRLLYNFSDVIVFVLKNPRVIEHVFERLMKWAAAALETSSNQAILPHAIIVLNASENDLDPSLWDARINTVSILDSLAQTINRNETFKKYAQWWRERGKTIDNLEQLILCYYSSIVVLRMPSNGRPKLMQEQVEKLYDGMISASMAARDRRLELRMLLDAEDFQSYLHLAFNHYAGTLQQPFDFVQASFANSPIPPDFGGNILKLALHIMDRWRDRADAADIFQQLSYMVASCIMFDSARQKIRGNADMIFPRYLEHLDAALENFCDQHWPCEYVKPGSLARCVNVRSGHGAKGHQAASGKVIAAGDYISDFSFFGYHQKFRLDVYNNLRQLLAQAQRQTLVWDNPERAAATIHKERVLSIFYKHITAGSPISGIYTSHTACFCCLFEMPEHALACGHVVCTSCIRIYGQSRGQNDFELSDCPIDSCFRGTTHVSRIHLKPRAAGVRILLLDGGGMRGIVELEALRAIEKELGGKIPVRSLFDLVAGTSTGGIIALGIGVKCWSVEESIHYFETLCKKAFTARKGTDLFAIGPMIETYYHSRYETKPLEDALRRVFSEDEYLFGGLRRNATQAMPLKVAVTGTTFAGDRAVVFANYNRSSKEKLSYTFQRPEQVTNELKIWEVARATSAAPRFFREFHHAQSNKIYVDGAIYHNNPVRIADQERKLIWPDIEDQHPDVVVSLGTAFSPSLRRVESTKMAAAAQTGIIAHGTQLLDMVRNHMATSITCERIWTDYLTTLPKNVKTSRFVRIDPELGLDVPQLDEVQHLQSLQQSARQQFYHDNRIHTVALQLVSALFYWETYRQPSEQPNGTFLIEGRILCRLAPGSLELAELGKFLRQKVQNQCRLQFIVKEQDQVAEQDDSYPLTNDLVTRMIDDARFEMHIPIHISSKVAQTEVSLLFTRKDWFPISGFPRSLLGGDERPTTRNNKPNNSNRWAGGSLRGRQARDHWKIPDPANPQYQRDTIADYASPSHGLQYHSHPIRPTYVQAASQLEVPRRGAPGMRAAFRNLIRPRRFTNNVDRIPEMPGQDPSPTEAYNSESASYKRWISTLTNQNDSDALWPSGSRPAGTAILEMPANHIMPVELPVDDEHVMGYSELRREGEAREAEAASPVPLPYRTASQGEGLQELFPAALTRDR